ncbi:MAG TPA: hypothetical protein VK166_00285 [Chitinophagaceae bacterium]|nr:hypothetical protein [Chitinophagaceae bacterium]
MEKVYRNTAIFIVIIILGVQWGFYQTYTSQFPQFKNKTNLIHIHGALLMCWMLLLVVQPMLIATGRASLHRAIGKISYVLGPLVIIMLFLIGRGGYLRSVGNFPEQENLATMVLDIRGFLSFALFWALAMINRKNSSSHMRYMIATGILAIGPGVGRGLITQLGINFHDAITITDLIEVAIPAICLGYDIYKKKNYKPWLTILVVLAIGGLLWQVKYSEGWQAFAAKYAALFY